MADSPLEHLTSVAAPIQPNERPLLIVLVGPTAVGKTRWAIEIARALNTEIVNADSRQIYRRMPIGTATPTAEERAEITHHFVDFVEPDSAYSAGQFEKEASAWLDHWFQHHRTAVLAGGSGLYVKALIEGLDDIPTDPSVRSQLNERFELYGLGPLVDELASVTPFIWRRWMRKIRSASSEHWKCALFQAGLSQVFTTKTLRSDPTTSGLGGFKWTVNLCTHASTCG